VEAETTFVPVSVPYKEVVPIIYGEYTFVEPVNTVPEIKVPVIVVPDIAFDPEIVP
jgi:hypothetical protein